MSIEKIKIIIWYRQQEVEDFIKYMGGLINSCVTGKVKVC